MRAQSSTEYLVIFAAIFVVALVVIFVLGNMPKMGEESLIKQSRSYWSSAFPIQILDVKYATQWGGTMALRVKNADMKPLWIKQWGIYLNNYPSSVGPSTQVYLPPGQEVTVIVWPPVSIFGPCNEGDLFEFDVRIDYVTRDGNTWTEIGSYPLVGRCVYAW